MNEIATLLVAAYAAATPPYWLTSMHRQSKAWSRADLVMVVLGVVAVIAGLLVR